MTNGAIMPEFTAHARKRWLDRCGSLDPETEWYSSRRAGQAVRRKIREGCPGHAALMKGRAYRGVWYCVSRRRVVFVIDGERSRIITVWMLPGPGAPCSRQEVRA